MESKYVFYRKSLDSLTRARAPPAVYYSVFIDFMNIHKTLINLLLPLPLLDSKFVCTRNVCGECNANVSLCKRGLSTTSSSSNTCSACVSVSLSPYIVNTHASQSRFESINLALQTYKVLICMCIFISLPLLNTADTRLGSLSLLIASQTDKHHRV